jgi:hypothetical protein
MVPESFFQGFPASTAAVPRDEEAVALTCA